MPHRLLVVEDDKKIADLVSRLASDAGFEVRATDRCSKTPSLYDEFAPDVIVLDILMPDMDGFEVLKFLNKRNSSTRVVILSGQIDYRLMASKMGEALMVNIAATIAKPFRIAELRQTLKTIELSLPIPAEGAALNATRT